MASTFLLPVFDQTFSSLVLDLESRGMLDETLVLAMSEHGRTPTLDSKAKGGGRDYWSRAYSQIYAGDTCVQPTRRLDFIKIVPLPPSVRSRLIALFVLENLPDAFCLAITGRFPALCRDCGHRTLDFHR